MASQRVEYLVIELFGNAWMREILAGWKKHERGSIPGFVESGVIIYIISKLVYFSEFYYFRYRGVKCMSHFFLKNSSSI